MALGARAAALVTSMVPLKTATGIPVIDPVGIAVGRRADLSMAGRAEAIALGKSASMLAKEAGSKLVSVGRAVIPAKTCVGMAVMFPAAIMEE